uniref:hypothetical protein n=1 Tax=Bacillus sp. FJAT-47783 TaxID=2922712 RepID=UPI001FADC4C5
LVEKYELSGVSRINDLWESKKQLKERGGKFCKVPLINLKKLSMRGKIYLSMKGSFFVRIAKVN